MARQPLDNASNDLAARRLHVDVRSSVCSTLDEQNLLSVHRFKNRDHALRWQTVLDGQARYLINRRIEQRFYPRTDQQQCQLSDCLITIRWQCCCRQPEPGFIGIHIDNRRNILGISLPTARQVCGSLLRCPGPPGPWIDALGLRSARIFPICELEPLFEQPRERCGADAIRLAVQWTNRADHIANGRPHLANTDTHTISP